VSSSSGVASDSVLSASTSPSLPAVWAAVLLETLRLPSSSFSDGWRLLVVGRATSLVLRRVVSRVGADGVLLWWRLWLEGAVSLLIGCDSLLDSSLVVVSSSSPEVASVSVLSSFTSPSLPSVWAVVVLVPLWLPSSFFGCMNEDCDDGNGAEVNACLANCFRSGMNEGCGNDGNDDKTDARRVGCVVSICGDGVVGGALLCGLLSLNGTSSLGICGLDGGEKCGDCNIDGTGACHAEFVARRCGGVVVGALLCGLL
jgi:hypothetical protein